jgi:putative ABC transport system permease protein
VNRSAIRALTRIAWRDIARHRGRSVLVALLVLLPVAAMVGGITIYRTTQISQERQDLARMGRADLIASAQTEADLLPYLPAGSTIERAVQSEGHLVLAGVRPSVDLRALDLDGLAQGMLDLVDGHLPHGSSEVAISRPVAALAKVGIGGTITLDGRPPATVVGLIEYPAYLDYRVVLVDPSTYVLTENDFPTWLIDVPDGADPEAIVEAYQSGATVHSITLEARGPSRLGSNGNDSASGSILVLGALALVEAALIASAAFAVSIRRRQRELGLLAATGATPRQLAAAVVAEAALLGLVACLGGVIVGLLGALALTPWLDELTQHRNGPLILDVGGVLGAVAVGFVAAIVAAVVPARTVARVPVLLALSGRRPSQAPASRTLWMGLAFVGLSVAMTIVGATVRDQNGSTNFVLLVGGAVLGTLGFGACSPWLLERLEGLASRLPVSGRIAFRDTARARSRSSPIVTAVLAGLAAAIALGAFTASRDAEELAHWTPQLHTDELVISGPGAAAAGADLIAEPGVVRGAQVPGLVVKAPGPYPMYTFPDARDADGKLINTLAGCSNCNPDAFSSYQVSGVAAATPALLALAHAEAGADDLRQGRVVLLTAGPMTATVMEVVLYDNDTGEITKRMTFPVSVINVGVRGNYLPEAFLPDAAIKALGLAAGRLNDQDAGWTFVAQYDHAIGDAEISRAQAIAAAYPDTTAVTDLAPVRPGEGFRFVLIGLVLLFAVSVTAIAIALGEAESRPEQRSLLALGADPRLRRRIAAARAAVLALLAGILAVPAGLLPMWGIFVSRGTHLAVPTLEIAAAVVLLPLLAVASAWLLSRPIPDWNAFRSVGTGQ